MRTKDFEKKVRHLSQVEILTGGASALNSILVKKGLVSSQELQEEFLAWMNRQGRKKVKSFDDMTLEELADLESKHTAFVGSTIGLSAQQEERRKKRSRSRNATNKRKK